MKLKKLLSQIAIVVIAIAVVAGMVVLIKSGDYTTSSESYAKAQQIAEVLEGSVDIVEVDCNQTYRTELVPVDNNHKTCMMPPAVFIWSDKFMKEAEGNQNYGAILYYYTVPGSNEVTFYLAQVKDGETVHEGLTNNLRNLSIATGLKWEDIGALPITAEQFVQLEVNSGIKVLH